MDFNSPSINDGYLDFHNALSLIKRVREETELLLTDIEAFNIMMAVELTGKIEGEIAEVGVYKGASAKLICEAKKNKTLHLFDTFEGLPELSPADDAIQFYKNQFPALEEEVKDYLKEYKNVHIYKGLFPGTGKRVINKKFSFVHLDVDLYPGTLNSLNFFYPRMSSGGIIISHDYKNSPGVKKAFYEFFENKPERVEDLSKNWSTQCLVTKL